MIDELLYRGSFKLGNEAIFMRRSSRVYVRCTCCYL